MKTTRQTAPALAKATRIALFAGALLALTTHPLHAQVEEERADEKADETLTAPRPWENPAKLLVQSNNWLDLHLYLVRDGAVVRSLGVVNGPGTAAIELPLEAIRAGGLVQILVEPIGGGDRYLSPVLMINPGDRVDLTVQNALSLSSESLTRR